MGENNLKPIRASFFTKCKTMEEYGKAFRDYRNAKKRWLKKLNRYKKAEMNKEKLKRRRLYHTLKDSEFRDKQNQDKPIKSLKEFI